MHWTREFLTVWWAGIRVALLRKVPRERFRAGWGTLWLLVLLYALGNCVADYLTASPPRVFYHESLWAELGWLSVVLLVTFLVSLRFAASGRVAQAAAAFYAILWLPELGFLLTLGLEDGLANDWRVQLFLGLWGVLCVHRWLYVIFDGPLLARAAGLVFVVAALTVASYLHSEVSYDFWYQDDAEESRSPLDLVEHDLLFQGQSDLLRQTQLAALVPSPPGEEDVYAVVVGSDAGMGVFMREAIFVRGVLERHLLETNRSVLLVNHAATLDEIPLATLPNIERAVHHIAGLMQPEEDILLLYLTSHGARRGALQVSLGRGLRLHDITASDLDKVLDAAGIRWRILIVSACYSGKMIEVLGDADTLVITSAAADRVSYGCADDSPLTYFAQAFFAQARPKSVRDLIRAFEQAAELIAEREQAEGITSGSQPLIQVGERMRAKLAAAGASELSLGPGSAPFASAPAAEATAVP